MSIREKKIEKRKKEILHSATTIIAEKGYHATTMEEIASNLLMTKGSIYYYFKDKKDLLYQSQKILLEQSIELIQEVKNLSLPIDVKLKKALSTHIEYIITERAGFGIASKPEQFFSGEQLTTILNLRNSYSREIDQLIEEGIEEGVFKHIDVKVVRNILLGAMNSVLQWYKPEGMMGKKEFAETISNYLQKILIK